MQEFHSICKTSMIQSFDQTWKVDETWRMSEQRTFFTHSKQQANNFAIGAYIPGYGATGIAVELFLGGGPIKTPCFSYTLSVSVPEDQLRSDTEFARRGDDEVYMIKPITTEAIRGLDCHRVWIQKANKTGRIFIAVLTNPCPFWRTWKPPVLRCLLDCEECRLIYKSESNYKTSLKTDHKGSIRLFQIHLKHDGAYTCQREWLGEEWMEF